MAALTLSGPSGFIGGADAWTGPFVGNSESNYVLRYSFRTPSDGYITSITFGTTFRHSSGETGTKYVRLKITESATSHINAGVDSDYDGTMEVSGAYDNAKTCTINGLWLKPNTTYYVYLFPGSQYFLKFCYDNSGNDLSSLSYNSIVTTHTLSISTGTGASASVRRTSSPSGSTGALSNGATLYAGDVLVISFGASTGYYLSSTSHTNGGSYTVSENVSVYAYATVRSYLLSLSEETGSTITVRRTSSPLAGADTGALGNGWTLYYGDVLEISFSVGTGYNLVTHTVNGSNFTSGGKYTVSGNVSVVSSASLKTYKLSISPGTGSVITVKRSGSTLSNGATINYGDVLVISFGANTGYYLTYTSHANGEKVTVAGNVSVSAVAAVLQYLLSISTGTGSTVSVTRTSSPIKGAYTGQLTDGAAIFHGDVLLVSFKDSALHEILTQTVNGLAAKSEEIYTVTGAVFVATTTRIRSVVYLTVGGVVKKFQILIYHLGKWRKYKPTILHGDSDVSAIGIGDAIVITTSLPVTTDGDTIIIGGA